MAEEATTEQQSAEGGEQSAIKSTESGNTAPTIKVAGNYNTPTAATWVEAPTHLKMAAGSMAYDHSYDNDEMPDMQGANSLFNNFSSFKYSVCGSIFGQYDWKTHYDVGLDSGSKFNDAPEKVHGPLKDIKHWDEICDLYYNSYTGDFGRNNYIDYIGSNQYDKPTAKKIIEVSQNASKDNPCTWIMPYSWNDFLYCKWYGKIPNNRMITLRRYAFPVDDLATNHKNSMLIPIAQAVTFFGEGTENTLSALLKMQWGLNWKEVTSSVQDVDGNEKGFGSGLEGIFGGHKITSIAGTVAGFARGAGQAGTTASAQWSGQGKVMNNWLKNAYTDSGAYWNQVLGPVNVVHKSHMRDRGFKWQNNISITFTYSLRSYYGVNPRVAALDIMSNMLRLTNNNGKWWGGSMRYFPNMEHKVGFLGDQEKFYNMEWEDYFKSVRKDLKNMGETLKNKLKDITPPDFAALGKMDLKGFLESLKATANSLMQSVGNDAIAMGMAKLAAATRPELLSIRTLLEGRPVGEWHLTIGNPLSPIAVMGNLLVDNCEFVVNDALGADDFPTELKFKVNLKHARPREVGDIESIFNMGMGRLSYTPLIATSSEVNTFGSAYGDAKSDKTKFFKNQAAQKANYHGTSQMARETYTEADTDDLTKYYDMADKNHKGIKAILRDRYGEAWSNSEYLSQMIDKSKLKI